MKKITFLVLFCFVFYGIVFSQNNLGRKYLAPDSSHQFTFPAFDTTSGGYVILGFYNVTSCSSNPNNVACVIRTDSTGLPLWSYQYLFCNSFSADDIKNVPAVEGTLSEILVAGQYWTADMEEYPFVLKLSSSGDIIWAKRLSNIQGVYSRITCTKDSGFLTCGITYWGMRALITKWDINGNIQWSKIYADSAYMYARHCIQLNDGYLIAGDAKPYNPYRPFLMRIDTNGNVLWYRRYILGSSVQWTYLSSLAMTSDSGFVISGYDEAVNKGFLLKVDKFGNFIWGKKYGLPLVLSFSIQGLATTIDNGLVVAGVNAFGSNPTTNYHFIMRTDSLGNPIWIKILLNDINAPTKIIRKNFFQYVFITTGAGPGPTYHYNKLYVFDTLSTIGCADSSINCNVTPFNPITMNSVLQNSTSVFATAFSVEKKIFDVSVYDECSGQSLPWGNSVNSIDEISIQEQYVVNISPNPATDELVVRSQEFGDKKEIEIYNVLGEKVFPSPLVPLSSRRRDERGEVINVSSLPSGIYFVKVQGEKEERVAKFVKQ